MSGKGGTIGKGQAWLQAELGKALSGWDEAMLQFLLGSVASSTKRSDLDEVVQNFLPGEPAAIAVLDAYFGVSPSSSNNGQQAAGQVDGWRQYSKDSKDNDLPEYRTAKAQAASEAKATRNVASERAAPSPPAKVLGMFNEGGRLRPTSGAAAGAGAGKRQSDKSAGPVLERPVVNCLGCGKIYDCRAATSDIARFLDKGGICTFCGEKVGLTYQERAAQLGQAAHTSPGEGSDQGGVQNGHANPSAAVNDKAAAAAQAAVEFKNRLVEYDRNGARRTNVIDDQSDYFEIDTNAWLTDQERSELRRRRQQEEEAAAAKRNRMTVTIDLIGRKVLVPDASAQAAAAFETSVDMATAKAEAQAAAAAAAAAASEAFSTSSVSRAQAAVQPKACAEAVLKASEALRNMKMTVNPHFASAFLPTANTETKGLGAGAGAGSSGGPSRTAPAGAGGQRGAGDRQGGASTSKASSQKQQGGATAATAALGRAQQELAPWRLQQGQQHQQQPATAPSKPQRLQGDLFSEFEEFGLEVLYEDALAAAAAAEAAQPFDICMPQPAAGGAAPLRPTTMAAKLQAAAASAASAPRPPPPSNLPTGMVLLKGYLPVPQQAALVSELRALGTGPGGFYTPSYVGGGQLHLKMMCLGWHWEPRSHGYEAVRSSYDGATPPPMPESLTKLVPSIISSANAASGYTQPAPFRPDVCLCNFYEGTGRLGYHQDKDESSEALARGLPVISISLGDAADMIYGATPDESSASSVRLESGDVLVFGGPARMLYHAIPRIHPGTAPAELLQATGLRPGRLNLTLRQIWL